MSDILAWHFLANNGRMAHDGQIVEAGYTYYWTPDNGERLNLCHHGLHASVRAIDALDYAPGNIACRVRMSGEIIRGDDKLVATERTVLQMANVEQELRLFVRQCALDVVHLWDAPQVVVDYLRTGEPRLRRAARAAASPAARDAAMAAESDAAWDAARAASRDAAWDATRHAVSDAESDAAWDSARVAAREKQNARLEKLLREALDE